MDFMKAIRREKAVQFAWSYVRRQLILIKHRQIGRLCRALIKKLYSGGIERVKLVPKTKFNSEYIIWQYWGQGFDEQNLPDLVKICIDSVDRYKDKCEVVRLCDANVADYLDMPSFVEQKRRFFSKAHYSDLLRLCLLAVYGGVWIDATVLLTKRLSYEYFKYDNFMFQRNDRETDKTYWQNAYAAYWGWGKGFKVRCLNSIFFAKKGSLLVSDLKDILLYVWEEYKHIPYYFFFQILYQELITVRPDYKCSIESDCKVHLLQQIIFDGYDKVGVDEALDFGIHKLSYKAQNLKRLKEVLNYGLPQTRVSDIGS